MAKANRGKLGNGKVYQQLRDPSGAHYSVTTPIELHNLLSRGYSLPDGVDAAEAAAYLAANVTRGPAALTATVTTGGGPSSGSGSGSASASGSGSSA